MPRCWIDTTTVISVRGTVQNSPLTFREAQGGALVPDPAGIAGIPACGLGGRGRLPFQALTPNPSPCGERGRTANPHPLEGGSDGSGNLWPLTRSNTS